MRYKERTPRPTVCQNCPEWSIKACLDCEHIRQRYEIDELDWLNEKETRRLLRQLLGVEREEQYHVLRWKSCDQLPAEDTNVLVLQYDAEMGHYCLPAHFNQGLFWYAEVESPKDVLEESSIVGWDYYPYEEYNDTKFENLMIEYLRDFAQDVRDGKAQWPTPILIENQPEV